LSGRGDTVTAVCRKTSAELDALGIRVVDGIDVASEQGAAAMRAALQDTSIDVLINNAGILRRDQFDELDYDDIAEQFRVNTLGPLRVTSAMIDRLGEGGKIVIITSRMGSIADNTSGGYYGYRVSKAAVNMIGKSLSVDLAAHGVAVALLHPGMVATDMTGGQGTDTATSASGLIERIDALTIETSGGFWHAEGYELPW
jgi:NAD(P)-dependent dehydrogenase (short-subunit alcohol dehydrogenase family)